MNIEKVYILFESDGETENVVDVFRSESYCNKFRDYYTNQYPKRTFTVRGYDIVDERNVTRALWESETQNK